MVSTGAEAESRRARKAWVVGVNVGYDHQHTARVLRSLSGDKVISANDYPGFPPRDREFWRGSHRFCEAISKFKRIPMVDHAVFRPITGFFSGSLISVRWKVCRGRRF